MSGSNRRQGHTTGCVLSWVKFLACTRSKGLSKQTWTGGEHRRHTFGVFLTHPVGASFLHMCEFMIPCERCEQGSVLLMISAKWHHVDMSLLRGLGFQRSP